MVARVFKLWIKTIKKKCKKVWVKKLTLNKFIVVQVAFMLLKKTKVKQTITHT